MYRRFDGFFALIIGTVIIGAAVVGVLVYKGTQNDRVVTIHVTDKERVCSRSNDSCQYLVYTDEGTFKDVDSILNSKFNSSDIYGQLKRDHTYEVKVEGYRSGWQSEYPNIISIVREVDQ